MYCAFSVLIKFHHVPFVVLSFSQKYVEIHPMNQCCWIFLKRQIFEQRYVCNLGELVEYFQPINRNYLKRIPKRFVSIFFQFFGGFFPCSFATKSLKTWHFSNFEFQRKLIKSFKASATMNGVQTDLFVVAKGWNNSDSTKEKSRAMTNDLHSLNCPQKRKFRNRLFVVFTKPAPHHTAQ